MKLNLKQICEYQQNRDPYLMIDYVEEVVPGKFANGYKDLNEDWFFKVHWPKDPNMPGMPNRSFSSNGCAYNFDNARK